MSGTSRSASDVRDRIVARRAERVAVEGPTLGVAVPRTREPAIGEPLFFPQQPPLICEIKRRSPSRGDINARLDPVALAQTYADAGARTLSVLTEEDHFGGSLSDLMAIKRALPELSVLRKDFLLTEEDVEVSYRAGADAVLLIASVLGAERLALLHDRAQALGMHALVEIHDDADLAAAGAVRAPLVGINARDLQTFRIDPLLPLALRDRIDWPATVIYESGIFHDEQAALAAGAGFGGMLVGEAVVRHPERITGLVNAITGELDPADVAAAAANRAAAAGAFWRAIAAARAARPTRPLVKICGITRPEDGRLAADLGATMLGFVFADSPRAADAAVVRELADLPVQRVAVVVGDERASNLPQVVKDLLREGALDAVQFHGAEQPDACYPSAFPYYKAVRLGNGADIDALDGFRCPRVLVDAYDPARAGGTGARIEANLVAAVAERQPLWLAGGLSAENIRSVVGQFTPELVDASSRLEADVGRKDHRLLRHFFEEIDRG